MDVPYNLTSHTHMCIYVEKELKLENLSYFAGCLLNLLKPAEKPVFLFVSQVAQQFRCRLLPNTDPCLGSTFLCFQRNTTLPTAELYYNECAAFIFYLTFQIFNWSFLKKKNHQKSSISESLCINSYTTSISQITSFI